jgi:hypothetical protein
MAALLDQLQQMHLDLKESAATDSEQEVTGSALRLLDNLVVEARSQLPAESTLRDQVEDMITWELFGEDATSGPRAADAALVIGQLLAVLRHSERSRSHQEPVFDRFITNEELPPGSRFMRD